MELQVIQNKIYEIRGYRVILDKDLAEMYEVTTSNLNKSVKRNIDRFPSDFMFQLTKDEFDLIFLFGMSRWGGTRKLPYAFTEHGVAMLAGLINSEKAISVNIQIVRAFVAMRQYLLHAAPSDQLKELRERIEALEEITEENEDKFDEIYLALAQLAQKNKQNDKPRNPVGFVKPQ